MCVPLFFQPHSFKPIMFLLFLRAIHLSFPPSKSIHVLARLYFRPGLLVFSAFFPSLLFSFLPFLLFGFILYCCLSLRAAEGWIVWFLLPCQHCCWSYFPCWPSQPGEEAATQSGSRQGHEIEKYSF